MTYLVVGATFSVYIGIAIWARAGSTKDFYVAGGGVNPVANGMATAADWMSAASFISMAGLIAFMGYGGSVFLMGWTGGFVLLAMLLAPYLRKYGKFTVPEFIGDRYYSRAARAVAVICLIICSVTYVIGQMKGIGVAFSRFLEVEYNTGLLIGMCIVFFYSVLGGMKGITYTQIAQFCVLILAYTIPAIFISLNLTGNPFPQLGLGSTMVGSETYLLDRLDQVVTDLGFNQYTTDVRLSGINMFAYTMSLMIGTAGLPHVIIRFFTVPKVRDARRFRRLGPGVHFHSLHYCAGCCCHGSPEPDRDYRAHPGRVPGLRGAAPVVQELGDHRLAGFEDKNDDGRIQYSADESVNEMVKVDRDIIVLANPEIAKLPNWVIALVAAGGLAAALSTAAGLLLAISSAISHDLLKGMIAPNITEKQELRASRVAMALAIAGAGYLGFNPPDFAAGTVALAFGLAASSIFPALMMGIFSQKVNREGAIAGMIAGIGITLFYVFQHKGIMFVASTAFLGDMPANWFLGIEPNAFGVVGAVVNFAVAMTVSRFTAETPEKVRELVEHIRIPVGATAAHDH